MKNSSNVLYYEDVAEGNEIPAVIRKPTTRQLVMWAGVAGDYNPIHYDKDYAQSKGLRGVIIHGHLAYCFLNKMVTDWIGSKGELFKLTCNYRGMNFAGEKLTCRGKVTEKQTEGDGGLITCAVWIENSRGQKTALGTASVRLPFKVKDSYA